MKRVRSWLCLHGRHKRFPLDTPDGSVVNVDGCSHCGAIVMAKSARYSQRITKAEPPPPGTVGYGKFKP